MGQNASYKKRDFGLVDIRQMVHTMFVDNLSRPSHSKPVAGRGIARQAAGHPNSDVRGKYCRGIRHLLQHCTILKAKEQRYGTRRRGQRTQPQRNQLAPCREKANGEQWRKEIYGEDQWCSFQTSTMHSDADCRVQHHNKTDSGSTSCATYSCYPAVLSTRDHSPGCDPEHPCTSLTAEEALTQKEEPWPFGPTDEPVASFGHSASGNIPTDTSGLFEAFGGVTGDKTDSAAFLVEKRPVRGLGLQDRITGGLASMIRALAIVTMIQYMWLSFGSSRYAQVVSKTAPDIFGGITGAEDGSAITASPVAMPWTDGRNGSVNVLVDSGASGHRFDDAIILGLRNKLDHYQALAVQKCIATPGRHPLKGAGNRLLRGHMIDAHVVQHPVQLSTWVVPGLGGNLFPVKRDGGGALIEETPKGGKSWEQPVSLGGASPARGVPQGGVLEHSE